MKFVIVFAALFAVAFAQSQDAGATIESQQSDIAPDHSSYSNALKTSNGIQTQESGTLVQPRSADESAAYAVQGAFSWIAADGQTYSVKYTADATGFHPEAAHLPVAPVA